MVAAKTTTMSAAQTPGSKLRLMYDVIMQPLTAGQRDWLWLAVITMFVNTKKESAPCGNRKILRKHQERDESVSPWN